MKMTFKIAKTELRNLFYSPIAWFLLIVFMVQCAYVYMRSVDGNAQAQENGGMALEYMRDLTDRIFTGREGLFDTVMRNLYLFFPLLTMGLISREVNGGTIKLLYSSPVKVNMIIFGKFLAMMIYSTLLVMIVGIFMIAGYFHIQWLDTGMLLSAVLGFYLLLCVYSAIGLFMSTLTTYQIVAAISTFVTIGAMSFIGTLWQDIDFVRDITYFLSPSGRTEKMLHGLITTKDVMYFIIITSIFLALSIYKLKAGRESKSMAVVVGRYAAVVIIALLLGYITSRPKMVGYLDTTRNHINTLTPKVQAIIKKFGDEPLEITSYNNLLDRFYFLGLPSQRNQYLSVWEPYVRFKPGIDFKYVNYYDTAYAGERDPRAIKSGKSLKERAETMAKNIRVDLSLFKSPQEIHSIADLKPEGNRFVMQVKYKDKKTMLRVFDDQEIYPGETEVAAGFQRLLSAKIPKIVFLSGNLERDITSISERDYLTVTNASTFRNSLINQGFDADTVSLDTQDIPADISALVIADPKRELSPIALSKIEQYIAKGGNVLIAGEPGKQNVLNPLLSNLGVKLMDGAIVQPDPQHSPDVALNHLTALASTFFKPLVKVFADSGVVTTPTATGIAYTENGAFQIKPLLLTNEKLSWLKKEKFITDSANIVFSAEKGDLRGSFPIAVALTRNVNSKEQRIIVMGDADVLSNSEVRRWNIKNANFMFDTGMFSWLTYGEFPIDTSRPESLDKRMKVSTDQVRVQKIIFIWILPGLLLLFGAVLLIRRKRK